ncbi:MAG: hypothetical protein EPN21_07050 [Methylococcaceae bacterium]|nr:MAG: hypothetical protein EPN21_07050 [Methylococcaceae bacterium]
MLIYVGVVMKSTHHVVQCMAQSSGHSARIAAVIPLRDPLAQAMACCGARRGIEQAASRTCTPGPRLLPLLAGIACKIAPVLTRITHAARPTAGLYFDQALVIPLHGGFNQALAIPLRGGFNQALVIPLRGGFN